MKKPKFSKYIKGMYNPEMIIETLLECPSECVDHFVQTLDTDATKTENAIYIIFLLINKIRKERSCHGRN